MYIAYSSPFHAPSTLNHHRPEEEQNIFSFLGVFLRLSLSLVLFFSLSLFNFLALSLSSRSLSPSFSFTLPYPLFFNVLFFTSGFFLSFFLCSISFSYLVANFLLLFFIVLAILAVIHLAVSLFISFRLLIHTIICLFTQPNYLILSPHLPICHTEYCHVSLILLCPYTSWRRPYTITKLKLTLSVLSIYTVYWLCLLSISLSLPYFHATAVHGDHSLGLQGKTRICCCFRLFVTGLSAFTLVFIYYHYFLTLGSVLFIHFHSSHRPL